MRYLPPVRWADVTPGTVVFGREMIPRTVIDNRPDTVSDNWRVVLLEGIARPLMFRDHQLVAVVGLDTGDAIGTLHTAGLNPSPIKGD